MSKRYGAHGIPPQRATSRRKLVTQEAKAVRSEFQASLDELNKAWREQGSCVQVMYRSTGGIYEAIGQLSIEMLDDALDAFRNAFFKDTRCTTCGKPLRNADDELTHLCPQTFDDLHFGPPPLRGTGYWTFRGWVSTEEPKPEFDARYTQHRDNGEQTDKRDGYWARRAVIEGEVVIVRRPYNKQCLMEFKPDE